jgi:hypothetical protein
MVFLAPQKGLTFFGEGVPLFRDPVATYSTLIALIVNLSREGGKKWAEARSLDHQEIMFRKP